jgi:predicted HicB family RNase H-like nuclease
MKRIIDGQTYNTETATQVFVGHGHFQSSGWWGLYQTRAGAFFQVVVNHDGEEVLKFGPVTDHEAQKLLEKHANHLVEKYFDVVEGGSAERRLTIRLPINLARRIESAAERKNASVNAYVMRALEQAVKDDGAAPIHHL